jgi:hypothetical protein
VVCRRDLVSFAEVGLRLAGRVKAIYVPMPPGDKEDLDSMGVASTGASTQALFRPDEVVGVVPY